MKIWKIQFLLDTFDQWITGEQDHPSESAARKAGLELACRCPQIVEWRVVEAEPVARAANIP